jgi:hypothetical protein
MLLVIAIMVILGSGTGFLALLPYGWGIGLLVAPVAGAVAGLLAGVLIACAEFGAQREAHRLKNWAKGKRRRQRHETL